MTKEQEIQKYMQVLDLTREQAEQLWEDDNSNYVNEEMAEMERKAKANRRYEQSDKPRAKAKRELKIDQEKANIIDFIWGCMLNNTHIMQLDDIEVSNPQREITFRVGENEYSLVLTKHRPKK